VISDRTAESEPEIEFVSSSRSMHPPHRPEVGRVRWESWEVLYSEIHPGKRLGAGKPVHWTPDSNAAGPRQDVGVDHGRGDITEAE